MLTRARNKQLKQQNQPSQHKPQPQPQRQQQPASPSHRSKRTKLSSSAASTTASDHSQDDEPELESASHASNSEAELQSPLSSAEKCSSADSIRINRAPVLTLWGATVSHYGPSHVNWKESCNIGRKIAGMLAQSKGKSIGKFEPKETSEEEKKSRKRAREKARDEGNRMKIAGFEIDKRDVEGGAGAAEDYLQKAFGDKLNEAKEAMRELVEAYNDENLDESKKAYDLYAEFRPDVAKGMRGWGQRGLLSLDKIKHMAQQHRQL
jgi:hypothetical protein